MNNFDKADIQRLISLIEPHPAIWNPRLKEVGVKEQRANAWLQVAKEMDKSVESVKSCWTSLRDYYQRYKRRWSHKGTSPAGSSGSNKPTWQFADQLRFLDTFEVESRRQDSATLAEFLRCRSAANFNLAEMPPVLSPTRGHLEDLSHSEFPSMVRPFSSAGGQQQFGSPPPRLIPNADEPSDDNGESSVSWNLQLDSDGHFGASVACRLRQLSSAVTRSQVRVAIEQILLRAELIDADQNFRQSPQY